MSLMDMLRMRDLHHPDTEAWYIEQAKREIMKAGLMPLPEDELIRIYREWREEQINEEIVQ